MAYTPADATVLMTDYIEPTVRNTFSEEDNTFRALMEGEKLRTSSRGRRYLYNVAPNPSYGSHVSGAALPVGGSGKEIEAKVFYYNQFLVGDIHKNVLEENTDKAVVDLLANRQRRDFQTFRQRQNLWMFGKGDGALGVIADASGGTTVVFGGDYGSENIITNSRLYLHDAAGARRVGGGAVVSTVLSNDKATGTVVFDQVPNNLAATDTGHYENSFGNAPSGLAKHVSDVSGDYFGINTALYDVKATVHDAMNNDFAVSMIDLAEAKASKRMGVNAPVNDHVIISHKVQELSYRRLGDNLLRVAELSGNARLDLGFKMISHNGKRWRLDQNCQRSVIYGLKLGDFKILFVRLPGFYRDANNNKLWQKPTEGGIYDQLQYACCARYDLFCEDRRNQWKIENLPYAAGI
jgi:hypothetical protein